MLVGAWELLTAVQCLTPVCEYASRFKYHLQGKLEELEAEMLEANGNSERLARSYNELVELQLVLEKAGSFFNQARIEAQAESFGDRSYSVPEAMDAPLLESALPVS
jgi:V-type H+-transporting ATPase subunit a